MSVMLYPCILCVALLMDMLSCVLRVCELFGETIRNVFGCGCDFVVECFGSAYCGCRCMYGLPKNVRVVPVIPVCI